VVAIARLVLMLLYKLTPSKEIAQKIAKGIFRFYELPKYIDLEENTGRADESEGAVAFLEFEINQFTEKLPKGSFDGIEFFCGRISPSKEFLQQYFVFCMSTEYSNLAIEDCNYIVELDTDMFETCEMILSSPDNIDVDGRKLFSHGPIEYYDIHNHPSSLSNRQWNEVYRKHSIFAYQNEYRAAFFVSEHFLNKCNKDPIVFERKIYDMNKNEMNFKLCFSVKTGADEQGWRYIELDISEFQLNITGSLSKIIEVDMADPA
jgi:hypothetical protein